MSQYSVPFARTGSFGNLLTSCSSTAERETRAAITRPPDAPRSAPATTTDPVKPAPGSAIATRTSALSQECGRYPRVDRYEQARGERQVAAAEREHGGGDVLGQHLALEQGPSRVE